MYKRIIDLAVCMEESCFLWGARQTGKSTLLRQRFPDALRYDLLLSDTYRQLIENPAVIREHCDARKLTAETQQHPIIIDEVQKIPEILDEIHWLIENRGLRFVLCGSSARKLRRGHANLLGGRALRLALYPFCYPEIPDFSLERALNHGLLPRHYQSKMPRQLLTAYVSDYLKEEIAAEALTRNIPSFNRFLEVAAYSNGEQVNYTNIASDCGVSSPTVKNYFEILYDTLIGYRLPAFRLRQKRRLVTADKFYFFDLGVVAHLARRGNVAPGSELFGRAFEHFIFMEITAHRGYSMENYPLAFWRTTSQFEVDFIIGDALCAIEVKASNAVKGKHLKGLRAFMEEHTVKRPIVVSCEPAARKTEDGIVILPWQQFLE
ncbi:MAG: ATP-binding protein, partial [Spartobacteria bacterium]|nr:ATP-binding protein [Spartobacteria bacterium]